MSTRDGESPESQPRGGGLRRGILFVAVLTPLLTLLTLLVWAQIQAGGKPANIAINSLFGESEGSQDPARDFELELFSGEALRPSDLRGKVVMLDFWSSWCPPCRAEVPVLAATYREFRERGVEFVGIAIWDEEGQVRDFLRLHGIDYPNGLDVRGAIAIDYGIRGIPEKFFLDRQGRVVRKFVGPVDREKLAQVLTELLAAPTLQPEGRSP
jgi:cytochrome c biogenesis protein CcmG/thiol:disulfide interchange protein DsbE